MGEYFDCCYGKLGGFQNLEQSLKTQCPLYWGWKSNFADEKCYTISAVSKIKKTFVQKEIRQPNGAQHFRGLTVRDQFLESLRSGAIYFLLCNNNNI